MLKSWPLRKTGCSEGHPCVLCTPQDFSQSLSPGQAVGGPCREGWPRGSGSQGDGSGGTPSSTPMSAVLSGDVSGPHSAWRLWAARPSLQHEALPSVSGAERSGQPGGSRPGGCQCVYSAALASCPTSGVCLLLCFRPGAGSVAFRPGGLEHSTASCLWVPCWFQWLFVK